MIIDKLVKPHPLLIERFRESPAQQPSEILKKEWRSIACMSCGACCCSSVIPILRMDFDAFHGRLGLKKENEEFAALFLQNPNPVGPSCHIETDKYGGRCMFLEKKSMFRCVEWEARPDVCREFFCWDMTNFEKYMNGEEQDDFSPDNSWEENFDKLLLKTKMESPLTFFEKEMRTYLGLLKGENYKCWFDAHREEMKV
ncbi:MAG: YkgJ family cysteine cluster protein [Nitrospinota bacterium]|nr:YkgJ family cysteine cluster protein [Nitrospinota bacterium]